VRQNFFCKKFLFCVRINFVRSLYGKRTVSFSSVRINKNRHNFKFSTQGLSQQIHSQLLRRNLLLLTIVAAALLTTKRTCSFLAANQRSIFFKTQPANCSVSIAYKACARSSYLRCSGNIHSVRNVRPSVLYSLRTSIQSTPPTNP